tara:strand:- start:373 stop:729 length:357 start_codon:yes stop_codon:yes gene_type:complete
MDEEIQESIKKECNDVVYWKKKEEQAKEGGGKSEDRLLDLLEAHYKDQLPTDGNFADIIVEGYEICVSNHRNRYNTIIYVEEDNRPPIPVTMESMTAEDGPPWAFAALASLLSTNEDE